jgi:hypothetical membrane protein
MSSKESIRLRITGVCGILAPLVAFSCILLAIAYYPSFSWTDNALSDLGVQNGIASALFNYGLMISGALALVFALGLFRLLEKSAGKIGTSLFILSAFALIMIGVFNENSEPMHFYASVAFFMLFPLSMLFTMVSFSKSGEAEMGAFTFLAAAVAASPWVAFFATRFVEGVAIPEVISALSASVWLIIVGVKMLRETAHSAK